MTHETLGIDASTALYFVFGAGGTAARIALSPAISVKSARFVIEVIAGGVGGFVLPYFGTYFGGLFGMDESAAKMIPPIIKAGMLFILAYSTSFSVGEILARRTEPPSRGTP